MRRRSEAKAPQSRAPNSGAGSPPRAVEDDAGRGRGRCDHRAARESPLILRTAMSAPSRTGTPAGASGTPFLTDVATLRKRARDHIEKGAVTSGYGADRQTVIKLLNDALATEIVCVLRYKRHYYMAQGLSSDSVKAEFLEHAAEEQAHADSIAERIVQLGGAPDLDPASLASRAHSEYVEGKTLVDMIREDLVAER